MNQETFNTEVESILERPGATKYFALNKNPLLVCAGSETKDVIVTFRELGRGKRVSLIKRDESGVISVEYLVLKYGLWLTKKGLQHFIFECRKTGGAKVEKRPTNPERDKIKKTVERDGMVSRIILRNRTIYLDRQVNKIKIYTPETNIIFLSYCSGKTPKKLLSYIKKALKKWETRKKTINIKEFKIPERVQVTELSPTSRDLLTVGYDVAHEEIEYPDLLSFVTENQLLKHEQLEYKE